jgi:hypothetical protein
VCLPLLQLAALQRRAKRSEEEAAPPQPEVHVAGPDGVPRALTMSNLRRDVATRAALLHEVAIQAEDVEDQIASLLQRVRQRFDRAGVPIQDVQIRFRGLSVTGMAAVKSLKPLPSSLLVEAVRVSGCRRMPPASHTGNWATAAAAAGLFPACLRPTLPALCPIPFPTARARGGRRQAQPPNEEGALVTQAAVGLCSLQPGCAC